MMLFSILFASIGTLFFVLGVGFWFLRVDSFLSLIFTAMGFVFAVIGFAAMAGPIRERRAAKRALREPEQVMKNAKVVDFVDGSGVVVNGAPPVNVVVQGYLRGEERTLVATKAVYGYTRCQLGSTCDVYIRGSDVVIDPESVRI